MKEKFTISLIVSNHYGVLQRVSSVYGKRGYNIAELHVKETEDPLFSVMTIASEGNAYAREQITKQLKKLHDVKKIVLLTSNKEVK